MMETRTKWSNIRLPKFGLIYLVMTVGILLTLLYYMKSTQSFGNVLLLVKTYYNDSEALGQRNTTTSNVAQNKILRSQVKSPKIAKLSKDKWIVVTSISLPSDDIKKLTAIKGWQVVVVGDLKTPSNWSFPGCIFLSVDKQKSLGYQLTDSLPFKSYTRKNIGYLYAIQNGARYVYDTDDDNHPIDGKLNFHSEDTMTGLIYEDRSVPHVNPYAHFGQPSIWPRGYPLEDMLRPNNNSYRLCSFPTPAIQQGLVNGDPDVDAIYRLMKTSKFPGKINISFDGHTPPLVLPTGTFAPFNSQNTFFTYDALWSLYLPSSVAFRVTDIWRGYWAQRLLWLLGHKLAFFPPNAFQTRNSHNYLKDFQDEEQVYLQTSKLIRFLSAWDCNNETSFFQCVRRLSNDMASSHFWNRSDAAAIDLWLSDLTAVGYEEPKMRKAISDCASNMTHRVYFSPVPATLTEDQGSRLYVLETLCENYFGNASVTSTFNFTRTSGKFENLLLVIVFNFPYYRNIHMLNALYHDHFPNIVYCGQTPTYDKLMEDVGGQQVPGLGNFSFINITSARGYFGYECAIRAMEMGYNVDGYVILGDDVLFNYWNLRTMDTKVAQLTFPSYREHHRNTTTKAMNWGWWGGNMGQSQTIKVLNEIEQAAKQKADTMQKKLLKTYLDNRYSAGVNMTNVSFCLSDFYYIPKSVANIFVEVMNTFLKHHVFLEIAVPTTIAGLHPKPITSGFQGISLWGSNRNKVFSKFYNSTIQYIHPLKFSSIFKNENARKEYCINYVNNLLKNW